jgi:hypothetical protein
MAEKLDGFRTLISIVASVRDILNMEAALKESERPPLRVPMQSCTSISAQSDRTRDLLTMLQSWATLQIRWREIVAFASTLTDDEWYDLEHQTIGEPSGSREEEIITFYAAGNPRKAEPTRPDDALSYHGKEPKLITIPESTVDIDVANPVAFLVENW